MPARLGAGIAPLAAAAEAVSRAVSLPAGGTAAADRGNAAAAGLATRPGPGEPARRRRRRRGTRRRMTPPSRAGGTEDAVAAGVGVIGTGGNAQPAAMRSPCTARCSSAGTAATRSGRLRSPVER